MTVETNTLSRKTETDRWTPKGRRQGEYAGWNEMPSAPRDAADDAPVFPSITPPPIWPRVFPGI